MNSAVLLVLSFILISCHSQTGVFFDFANPYQSMELPSVLHEVSGLTVIDDNRIACIQDEVGTVFLYNITKGFLEHEFPFDSAGDYEAIAYSGKSLFILRSDGRLSELVGFGAGSSGISQRSAKDSVIHYILPLITRDNEGLCFDKSGNRLLIAAKSKPLVKERKDERIIYAFNLGSRSLEDDPAFVLHMSEIEKLAVSAGITSSARSASGKSKPLNFRPSGLAIHPENGDIYVISAEDFLLLVVDRNGSMVYLEQLPANLFAKAEGISFLSDGSLIISNEGLDGIPTLRILQSRK